MGGGTSSIVNADSPRGKRARCRSREVGPTIEDDAVAQAGMRAGAELSNVARIATEAEITRQSGTARPNNGRRKGSRNKATIERRELAPGAEAEAEAESEIVPVKKKRGRPKGSKNKPKPPKEPSPEAPVIQTSPSTPPASTAGTGSPAPNRRSSTQLSNLPETPVYAAARSTHTGMGDVEIERQRKHASSKGLSTKKHRKKGEKPLRVTSVFDEAAKRQLHRVAKEFATLVKMTTLDSALASPGLPPDAGKVECIFALRSMARDNRNGHPKVKYRTESERTQALCRTKPLLIVLSNSTDSLKNVGRCIKKFIDELKNLHQADANDEGIDVSSFNSCEPYWLFTRDPEEVPAFIAESLNKSKSRVYGSQSIHDGLNELFDEFEATEST
jgi:hypothetical protein